MNIFRFLYQLTCSHLVQKMKCECGEEYQKLCSWKDIRKECKGCPYLYFECQECGKYLRISNKVYKQKVSNNDKRN